MHSVSIDLQTTAVMRKDEIFINSTVFIDRPIYTIKLFQLVEKGYIEKLYVSCVSYYYKKSAFEMSCIDLSI
jgi:hypothetical protein